MSSAARPPLLAPALRAGVALILAASAVTAALVVMTLEDFHVPGTQVGDTDPGAFLDSEYCRNCHGDFDVERDPHGTWAGSLMANAGRDPLFFAQLTTANQDVANVGTYCIRCHVPMSVVTGSVVQPDGSALGPLDQDGVTCHFCHSLVDPLYQPGISPQRDADVLRQLADVPRHYGNAMFVLDPDGVRRGPRRDSQPPHELEHSPFHRTSELCGTCHDVGNVATLVRRDGSWRYDPIGQRAADPDPCAQFPLERTYTEWRLSEFARGGVDLEGRFGGDGAAVVSSCQDCHMPRTAGQACFFGPVRPDLRRHEFAGAAAQVLELIGEFERGNPTVDQPALERGRRAALSMLRRAATLELAQAGSALRVRVTNQSGHKLPTGHIEGRRVFLRVGFRDAGGTLLYEYGSYDSAEARLDEHSTRVYEMVVGLSREAAAATGLPPGATSHMALADTIVKDNRIPPRGFQNAAFEGGGAPVVDHVFADGQYWDDAWFTIPPGAAAAEVGLYYQSLPREYVETLRDGNVTDHWGATLHDLWVRTGRGVPIPMADAGTALGRFQCGDVDGDCDVDADDRTALIAAMGRAWNEAGFEPRADLDGDHRIAARDLQLLEARLGERCP